MGVEVFNSWATLNAEDQLENILGGALVKRAKKRHVYTTPALPYNVWFVSGNESLGDAYPSYKVRHNGKRYECQCQEHHHGHNRSKCSHIVAVMLYRSNVLPKLNVSREVSVEPRETKAVEEYNEDASLPLPPSSTAEFPFNIINTVESPLPSAFGENPPLPAKFEEIFSHQWMAAVEIFSAFQRGEKIVMTDAPPGTGKTLLGELVRRLLQTSALYVCTTKSLQDQFMADFPYAKLLKGRSNYPTLDAPERFLDDNFRGRLTAADCQKSIEELPACASCPSDSFGEFLHCANCHPWTQCPYEIAKSTALGARELAVINTSYFIAECNSAGKFSSADDMPHFGLVIMDEADMLEGELMSHVEVVITKKMQEKIGIVKPKHKTVATGWPDWAIDAHQRVLSTLKKIPTKTGDVSKDRERKAISALCDRLLMLSRELPNGGWVYDGYNSKRDEIIFRPIHVSQYGQSLVWRHAPRFLLMSGTFIDPKSEIEDVGMEEEVA